MSAGLSPSSAGDRDGSMADIEEGNAAPEPSPRTIEQPAVQAMPNVVEVRPPEEPAAERQSPAPASPRSEVSALSAGRALRLTAAEELVTMRLG